MTKIEKIRERWTDNSILVREGFPERLQAYEHVAYLLAEVERLRSYKSLPPGMVWQDYYSPDDVCKIRQEYEAEIERLRSREDKVAQASYETGQRDLLGRPGFSYD